MFTDSQAKYAKCIIIGKYGKNGNNINEIIWFALNTLFYFSLSGQQAQEQIKWTDFPC